MVPQKGQKSAESICHPSIGMEFNARPLRSVTSLQYGTRVNERTLQALLFVYSYTHIIDIVGLVGPHVNECCESMVVRSRASVGAGEWLRVSFGDVWEACGSGAKTAVRGQVGKRGALFGYE